MMGVPPLPDDVQRSATETNRDELLIFRSTQHQRSKFFTNGKHDFRIVSGLLKVFDAKRSLKAMIECHDCAGILILFSDNDLFSDSYSQSDFANDVFDKNFTTPLHIAVASKSVESVRVLLSFGAEPRLNCQGDLPWEWKALPRLSQAASVAAYPGSGPLSHADKGSLIELQELSRS